MPLTLIAFAFLLVLGNIRPLAAQSVNVTTYPVSGSPMGITKGSDGALWFTESAGSKIGRIATDGTTTEYPLPTSNAGPYGITAGPDGALWFTEALSNKVGRITTAGVVAEYLVPSSQGVSPSGLGNIVTGPDDALWFITSNTTNPFVGRITTNGVFTEYPLSGGASALFDLTPGPDGALWVTQAASASGGNAAILQITTAGTISSYSLSNTAWPHGITTGPDGALWFTESTPGAAGAAPIAKIGRITTAGMVTEYPLSNANAGPYGIITGPDGSLWFTETDNRVGRITTAGTITEYDQPLGGQGRIAVGPDGALWFTGTSGIGRLTTGIQSSTRSGVLSHIAAGGGWTTVITLVNTLSSAVPVTVAFHNDDGSALNLPVTTTLLGATQSSTTASVSATINANATLLITTGQLSSAVVGWADVSSTSPLGGFAIFRQTPQTGSPSEGTVPLQNQFPSTITLAYDNTAGFIMGVALANLSATSANVTATIWDDSGNPLGAQTLTIAGNGHTSFVLPNQLLTTAGKRGTVRFQSSGGIAGIGIRFSPFGTFTSVPAM